MTASFDSGSDATAAQRIQALFQRLLDLPPDERRAELDRTCPDAPAVRREVEELLRAHDGADSFLADRTVELSAPTDYSPGQHIGH